MIFTADDWQRLGLGNRNTRHTIVHRARHLGWLEVRHAYSANSQYAYRLKPGAQAAIEVVDLAVIRNRRRKSA